MKYLSRLLCVFGCMILLVPNSFATTLHSAAFYYGPDVPQQLRVFNVVVVQPRATFEPQQFTSAHSQPFAYVSIGEVGVRSPYLAKILPAWVLGQNEIWEGKVLDQTNPKWREFFLNKIIGKLWKQGYRGFFLDTLDSYQLVAKTVAERNRQEQGLIKLIKAIKAKYPTAKLIFNRGFELLPAVHKLVYAVAAESLFKSWNQKQSRYADVSAANSKWLQNKLTQIKDKYKLPIIVIDYVAPTNRVVAQSDAKKISQLGFVPWVTNGSLTALGASNITLVPRKILMFYDDVVSSSRMRAPPLLYTAMPLQYLGYKPLLRDVRKLGSPPNNLRGRYAGLLIWADSAFLRQSPKVQAWIAQAVKQQVPVVILGEMQDALSKNLAKILGVTVKPVDLKLTAKLALKVQSKLVGYEIKPHLNIHDFLQIKVMHSKSLLLATVGKHKRTMVALTNWGGYAVNPFVLNFLPNGRVRWVIDPIHFLQRALRLQVIPAPDVTTGNGLRLMMVHVDGDGFASKAEWYKGPFAGQVMLDQIFKRYKIPTTVSIIQAELSVQGLYPQHSRVLEKIAREIFALPWVEIASHSFSHPFSWQRAMGQPAIDFQKNLSFYLPVPNYSFNLSAEIGGSKKYIDTYLAPKGKKCKVFLWTGDCDPGQKAVAATYKNNLLNMNGAGALNRLISHHNNSIADIAPLGTYRGKYYQVFAPLQNENIYTNLWTGPFYGYRRAIEAMELTNSPRRFKPIDVYYHFFSATKNAALRGLEKVYDWALGQNVYNIFASDYIKKVLDFNNTAIAKERSGWLISNRGELRELRVSKKMGYPDLQHSTNVIGYSSYGPDYYVHLGDKNSTYLQFTKTPSKSIYIVTANAKVSDFVRSKDRVNFKLTGYMPLKFVLANVAACRVTANDKIITGEKLTDGNRSYRETTGTTATVAIQCNYSAVVGS